jgi:N-dimethylarginine dimethylaminohydrolase
MEENKENIKDLVERHTEQGSLEMKDEFPPVEIGYTNEYSKLESVMIHIPRIGEVVVKDAKEVMFKQVPNYDALLEEVDQYRTLLMELGIKVYDDIDFRDTDLNPFPNQIFARDLAIITPNYYIMANPKYKVRKGEEFNAITTIRRHGYVGQVLELPINITMEGADFFWINEKEVLISVGNRTSELFAETFQCLYPDIKVRTVAAAAEGIPQHILGGAHIVDKDTIIQRKAIIKHDLGFKNVIELEETDEVVNRYAMNIVTIGPMEIIMPSGNPKTKAIYEANGIKVHESPAREYGKCGGAFACATLPIKRAKC